MNTKASIEIVEEPASYSMRFRYFSERKSGSILGANTTEDRKTCPAIKIVNYTGKVSVLVSCVTTDAPYKSHPHELIGQNCARGVCYIANFTTNSVSPSVLCFPKLRIQSAKKNEIEEKLRDRQNLRVDPFGNGFKHMRDVKRALNSVRLCFQVIIIPDPNNPTYKLQLKPKVTQPIYNVKIATELIINDISDTSSLTCGDKKIMIFCNKISKGNIKVRFFRKNGEDVIWEDWGARLNVHRNFGISFTTPRYAERDPDRDINIAVNVFVQLVRPSDNVRSTPISFRYISSERIMEVNMKRKKCKIKESEELFQLLSNIYQLNIPLTFAQHTLYSEHKVLNQEHPEQQQQLYSQQHYHQPYEIEHFYKNNIPQGHFLQKQQHQQHSPDLQDEI